MSKGQGDTLAEFVVNEIYEKWQEPGILSPEDPAAAAEKIQQCASAMRKAEGELAAVAKALENLSDSLQPSIRVAGGSIVRLQLFERTVIFSGTLTRSEYDSVERACSMTLDPYRDSAKRYVFTSDSLLRENTFDSLLHILATAPGRKEIEVETHSRVTGYGP